MQHADSEGTLLVDKDHLSILPTTVSSNPELKTAVPGMIQNAQDHESSTGTLDDSRLEEKAKSAEDRIGGETGPEEDLMGVEQVADFASSVLAAISCWRYRALLFDQITTVRVTYRFLFQSLTWCPPRCNLSITSHLLHAENDFCFCTHRSDARMLLMCSCMNHCMDITACMATSHTLLNGHLTYKLNAIFKI